MSWFQRSGKSSTKAKKLRRGVVVVRSGSTGLLGGKDTELRINGVLQQLDWDKAMLLANPTDTISKKAVGH